MRPSETFINFKLGYSQIKSVFHHSYYEGHILLYGGRRIMLEENITSMELSAFCHQLTDQ